MMFLCFKFFMYNINKYLEFCVMDFKLLLNFLKGNYKKFVFFVEL